MTYKKMKKILESLEKIVLSPIMFNGLKIEISHVCRALHPKDWNIKPHHHPWFEFNFVQSGSLYNKINDTEFLAKKGDSYIVNPGVTHSHINNKTGDDGICIRFNVENLDRNNTENENFITVLYNQPERAFDSGFENFPVCNNELTVKSAFVQWLVGIYDNKCQFSPSNTLASQSISNQVIMYLSEYYPDKIYVNDLAEALNTSYRTLCRKFKEETGITISDKLTQIRINAAKGLLLESNMHLLDVAECTGYENEYYFSNAFKKSEGISPSQYRKQKSPLY